MEKDLSTGLVLKIADISALCKCLMPDQAQTEGLAYNAIHQTQIGSQFVCSLGVVILADSAFGKIQAIIEFLSIPLDKGEYPVAAVSTFLGFGLCWPNTLIRSTARRSRCIALFGLSALAYRSVPHGWAK